MTKDRLETEYFEWMYNLVCGIKKDSYRKLLYFLHSQRFYYLLPMDHNRAEDGVDLRYRFGNQMRYSAPMVASYLDSKECSVLEMMVALANRCEESIMSDPELGDRTSQWFFVMLSSLGLSRMTDDNFDETIAEEIIHHFLERDYTFDGVGGLFTLKNTRRDLRTVEIWYQMNWYLNEYLEGR